MMADLTAIYQDKSPSLGSKITLVCLHLLLLVIVGWLVLGGGIAVLDNFFGRPHQLASNLRRAALVTAASFYFLRTLATIFVFLKRRMPWSEVGMIALWVALIDVLFAYFGGRHEGPFGPTSVLGVVLVLAGSAINSGAELQRHLWKQRPENGVICTRAACFDTAAHQLFRRRSFVHRLGADDGPTGITHHPGHHGVVIYLWKHPGVRSILGR